MRRRGGPSSSCTRAATTRPAAISRPSSGSRRERVSRTNYSTPPTHGAAAITTVLSTPALRALWEDELAGMRDRIKRMRVELQRRLLAAGAGIDTDFTTRQGGMFSYSGLR